MICAGAAGAVRSDCGGSRWRLHSLRTSTRSFWTPPASLAVLPSLSLSTTTAKVRATLYSSRPERRMASPMRMRGGRADDIGCAAIAAAGVAAGRDDLAVRADGEDFARLRLLERLLERESLLAGRLRSFAALRMTERFGRRAVLLLPRRDVVLDGWAVLAGRSGTAFTCLPAAVGRASTVRFCARLPMAAMGFLATSLALPGDAAGADDSTAREGDDANAAEDADFASRADGDDANAAEPDGFATRANGDHLAAIVVASPKSTAKASLVASGAAGFTRCSAGFLRLRLRARFLGGEADLVADAFRFSCMGVCGARRADDWRWRQARDVVESEDRAEKRVVMCGAEEFAAASWSRAGQPGWAARAERYDGDAVRRHGFGSTGIPACASVKTRRGAR